MLKSEVKHKIKITYGDHRQPMRKNPHIIFFLVVVTTAAQEKIAIWGMGIKTSKRKNKRKPLNIKIYL